MNLNKKKAVVFGGTSGIGRATSIALADQGAEVYVVSRNAEALTTLPETIRRFNCDVCDEDAVRATFAKIGPLDIIISSATGGSRTLSCFPEMDMDSYRGSFAKLWGYAHVVRHGIEWLRESGAIVLVSGSPARRCDPGQVALSSVGAAIEAMVRGVAKEIVPRRINALCPGLIDTPILQKKGAERIEHYKKFTAGNLIPRPGTPEECAHGILFLLENEFVTGTVLDVDGGRLLS
ncbi:MULTISPECIES: SDR family NAD(P)-dependent oxidoreductase [Marinobacter]|uniref:SDR family NAD(P)-dependent oxidoreductase n=1 Tax=Marinobacter TaxID=2742 RepID=UPI003B437291|nr:SDR family oxidoreductase [Marinobacter alkaliphilus]